MSYFLKTKCTLYVCWGSGGVLSHTGALYASAPTLLCICMCSPEDNLGIVLPMLSVDLSLNRELAEQARLADH